SQCADFPGPCRGGGEGRLQGRRVAGLLHAGISADSHGRRREPPGEWPPSPDCASLSPMGVVDKTILPTAADIEAAAARLAGVAVRTPLISAPVLDETVGA